MNSILVTGGAGFVGSHFIELLSKQTQPPQTIFAALPDSVNTPELRIEMEEGQHFIYMQELIENADFADAQVSTIDGLRVDFEDGFGLVRPSNTTPILVLRFEADSKSALLRIQDRFRRLLLTTRPNVTLPF